MQADPAFWSFIVAFIDRKYPAGPLEDSPIHTSLRLSKDVQLFIYLVRKVAAPPSVDVHEYPALKGLMDVIWAHMSRVHTLAVHTNHSSSLPDVGRILYYTDPSQLRTLILKSNSDDSVLCWPPTRVSIPSLPNPTPSYPTRLTDLRIDGRSCLALLERDRYMNLYVVLSKLHFLCITNLTYRVDRFNEGKIGILFNVITTIPQLDTLVFDTFELASPPPSPLSHQVAFPAAVRLLKVRRSGGDSLRYILECIAPEELCLGTCHFTTPCAIPARSGILSLVGIADCEGLMVTLSGWSGMTLDIVACPFFTNTFLGHIRRQAIETRYPLFANLHHLRIVDCPNFTPGALLDLLTERAWALINAPRALPTGANEVVLESLEVTGRSPKLGNDILGQTWNVAHSLDWPTTGRRGDNGRSLNCPSPTTLLQQGGYETGTCQCLPCRMANVCFEAGLVAASP
jgi:hypothetical protein